MPITFEKTEIDGILVINAHTYMDDRGMYMKYYEKNIFSTNGVTCLFHECSDLYSKKGALRGLHYQTKEPQAKLLHVVSGILFDVAVDLREESETYGRYHTELLTDSENKIIYIPERFAHGFIALTDDTVFSYQSSGRYIPEACGGIRWDSPELKIPWPLDEYGIDHVITTEKDRNWPTFEEISKNKIKFEFESEQ